MNSEFGFASRGRVCRGRARGATTFSPGYCSAVLPEAPAWRRATQGRPRCTAGIQGKGLGPLIKDNVRIGRKADGRRVAADFRFGLQSGLPCGTRHRRGEQAGAGTRRRPHLRSPVGIFLRSFRTGRRRPGGEARRQLALGPSNVSRHVRASFFASAICAGVIFSATRSRFARAGFSPREAARANHLCAAT